MRKTISLILSLVLMLTMFPQISLGADPDVRTENFQEFALGRNVDFTDHWLISASTMPELTEIIDESGNKYLQLKNKSETDVDQNSMVLTKPIFTHDSMAIGFRFRKPVDSGDMKIYFRAAAGTQFHILTFSGEKLNVLYKDYGNATGEWLTAICKLKYINSQKTQVTVAIEGYEERTQDMLYDLKSADLRFQIVQKNNISALDLDDFFVKTSSPVVTLEEENAPNLPVNAELHVSSSIPEALGPVHFLLNGEYGKVSEVEKAGEGYILRFAEPLQKNTEYTLKVEGYTDSYGLGPVKNEFKFHTRNTSFVWERQDNGDFKIYNTAEATEEALVLGVSCQNGSMTGWKPETVSLGGGLNTTFSYPGATTVVMMDSLMNGVCYDYWTSEQPAASDSDEFVLKYDELLGVLTAKGKMPNAAGELVFLKVFNPDYANVNLDTADETTVKNAVSYLGCTRADANGGFVFSYKPTGVSGEYKAVVTGHNSQALTDTMNCITLSDVSGLCNALNNAKNTNDQGDIEDAIVAYYDILKLNFPLYDDMEDKDPVYAAMLKKVKDGFAYTTTSEVVQDIKEFSVVTVVNQSDAAGIVQIIGDYADIVNFENLDAYSVYDKQLTEEQKPLVFQRCAEKKDTAGIFNNISEFQTELQQQMIFILIENAEQYNTVKEAIEAFSDVLELDMTAYEKNGSPSYVAKKLINNHYEDQATFEDAFEQFLDDYIEEKRRANRPSGSSGGKSSGGSGGGMAVEKVVTDIPVVAPAKLPVQDIKDFTDLDLVPWAAESIRSLQQQGIIDGSGDGTFKPNDPVTREQFLKMLLEYLKLTDETASCDFKDVEKGQWYTPYVATGKKLGIASGVSEESFGIGLEITRQDMAVMILKAVKATGVSLPNTGNAIEFEDDIAPYAKDAVDQLTMSGILSGMGDGNFRPTWSCTRAEAAKVIFSLGGENK